MDEFNSKFLFADFIYEKSFDSKKTEILKDILDKQTVSKIFSSNIDLLKCNCGVILTKKEEYHLFRKYNYLKYRINKISKDKKTGAAKKKIEINKRLNEIYKIREIIIKCNLRLIVKCVTKYFGMETYNYEEFFSNGYIHLIRSIDGFDYRRNFKFSTYFMNVLFNNLYKDKLRLDKNQIIPIDSVNPSESNLCEVVSYREQNEKYNSEFIKNALNCFADDKRGFIQLEIIKNRFGILGEEKRTIKEISERMGLSTSRVKQLTEKAIEKIRKLNLVYDPVA